MTPADKLRCEIARMFGKWPWEIDALPYRRYRRLRLYYEARQEDRAKQFSETNALADAEWETEQVTTLE